MNVKSTNDASKVRTLARCVGGLLVAIEFIGDAGWRWRYAKYSVRSSTASALERWAHRHNF